MAINSPLAGLRVVECCGWNGVFGGRILADGGADVVRVVAPGGDPLDSEPPFFGDSGVSIQGTWYNAGKRIVALDLDSAGGRGELATLLAAADVLIEDWAPGTEPAEAFARANPALVRVSVTPAGREGAAPLVTNDLAANALSGSASVTGDATTPPLSGYGNQTYHTVGMYVAICALAALRAARLTRKGTHIDLSAHEALISCTEQVLMEWFFPGTWKSRIAKRQGSLHWSGAYEVYPGRTGQGVMVTAQMRFMEEILPWMASDGMAGDLVNPERFPTFVSMVQNLPYVMQVMRDWVASKDPVQLFFEAQERKLPWGVVLDVKDALATPQIEARGWLQPVAVEGFGDVRFPGRLLVTNVDEGHPGPAAKVEVRDLGWEPRQSGGDGTSGWSAYPPPTGRPLEGVRIMDFTHVLAGPFGTRVLGDLGADVIKIGTASRAGGAGNPSHPYFTSWNRNKRNVSLNMGTEEGRAIARRLAERSDVVIDNFSAGVLERWGLDRAGLADVNPRISVVNMGGMGNSGPWRHFVTFAPTIHALTGLTYLTNPPGTHTLGYGYSLTDHLAGLAGAIGCLEGIEHARRTGEGLTVDVSQYELGLTLMGPAYLDYLANGVNPEPVGNRHPFGAWAPHGIYRAAGDDRWVAIAVRGDDQWRSLCRLMGREELAADARFASHAARLANEDALDSVMEDWTRGRDRFEVMDACQAAGIAAGAVQDAEDLTTRDPRTASRGFFGTAVADPWGAHGIDRFPALFDGQRPAVYEGVHGLGADTFDVLQELGIGDEEFAGLVASGVLS